MESAAATPIEGSAADNHVADGKTHLIDVGSVKIFNRLRQLALIDQNYFSIVRMNGHGPSSSLIMSLSMA